MQPPHQLFPPTRHLTDYPTTLISTFHFISEINDQAIDQLTANLIQILDGVVDLRPLIPAKRTLKRIHKGQLQAPVHCDSLCALFAFLHCEAAVQEAERGVHL